MTSHTLRFLNCEASRLPKHDAPIATEEVSPDRLRGMLLGVAIGDALGNTSEGWLPKGRKQHYGRIEGYLPNRYVNDERRGFPSDDTQMSFWLVEHLLKHSQFIPEQLAEVFTERHIFGMGSSVRQFRSNFAAGKPWDRAGPKSAGNGALMRIAPIVGHHIGKPSEKLWEEAAICSAITHNDPASIACCVAYVAILSELLVMERPPEPEWWVRTFEQTAPPIEGTTKYRPRGGHFEGRYEGPVSIFAVEEARNALASKVGTAAFGDRVYSGAYLLETMPCVLFILAKYGDNPERAILEAVNGTKDNDTIAAIVGGAMGALYGAESFPEAWVSDLTGSLGSDTDTSVFELTDRALDAWLN